MPRKSENAQPELQLELRRDFERHHIGRRKRHSGQNWNDGREQTTHTTSGISTVICENTGVFFKIAGADVC
jgi:hypothetical protein